MIDYKNTSGTNRNSDKKNAALTGGNGSKKLPNNKIHANDTKINDNGDRTFIFSEGENYSPRSPIFQNMPQELQSQKIWVTWKPSRQDGSIKTGKIPFSPISGKAASSTNPKTWGTFEKAVEAYKNNNGYAGVGIMLQVDSGIVGIDLDNCCSDLVDDIEKDWAREISSKIESYQELSPSGTGLRIIAKGCLPAGGRRREAVEMYDRDRFLTLTGNIIGDYRGICDCSQAILEIHEKYIGGSKEGGGDFITPPEPEESGLRVKIEETKSRFNRSRDELKITQLIGGNIEGYDSGSEADMALISKLHFYSGGDYWTSRCIFMESTLASREKWSEREDYLFNSIWGKIKDNPVYGMPSPTKAKARPKGFTASALMSMKLEPLRWAVDGLMPTGLTMLVGAPKLGKSWLCLQLVIAIAAGDKFLGNSVSKGNAVYLALEDGKHRLQERLAKILDGKEPPCNLYLYNEWPNFNEGGLEELDELILELRPSVIIIDTWQKVRKVNKPRGGTSYESEYGEVSALKTVADQCGTAIVAVHHLSKQKYGASSDFIETINGSMGISGAADTILCFKRARGTGEAELLITGRDIKNESAYTLTKNQHTMAWEPVGFTNAACKTPDQEKIFTAIGTIDKATPKTIAQNTGLGVQYIKNILPKLLDSGAIRNIKHGVYELTNKKAKDDDFLN